MLFGTRADIPQNPNGAFIFAIDHCFPIKGSGTVLTGTVLSGSASTNDIVEIPLLKLERKIKSMQVFRRPTHEIRKGDRAGICVTQLDSGLIERGYACSPGSIYIVTAVLATIKRIKYASCSESRLYIMNGALGS